MSRKHHDHEVARGSGPGRDGSSSSSKAVWDTGSSLYDSYELAAVRRLLDRRLLAAAGVPPLPGEPPATAETRGKTKHKQGIVAAARARRKVTLRALFRAVATLAARPRRAPLSCACAGTIHGWGDAAVEPDVPSHGGL